MYCNIVQILHLNIGDLTFSRCTLQPRDLRMSWHRNLTATTADVIGLRQQRMKPADLAFCVSYSISRDVVTKQVLFVFFLLLSKWIISTKNGMLYSGAQQRRKTTTTVTVTLKAFCFLSSRKPSFSTAWSFIYQEMSLPIINLTNENTKWTGVWPEFKKEKIFLKRLHYYTHTYMQIITQTFIACCIFLYLILTKQLYSSQLFPGGSKTTKSSDSSVFVLLSKISTSLHHLYSIVQNSWLTPDFLIFFAFMKCSLCTIAEEYF